MNPLNVKNKQDRLNKVYDSDGEPVIFCYMEDIEDTQYFYEYSLPDVFTPDAGFFSLVMKVMNLLRKEGTSQILNLVT